MVTQTMPSYDFHCNNCGEDLTLFYKTYKDYDAAVPTCPMCESTDLTRVITRVNIGKGGSGQDYTKMSAQQMLSVFESGDSKAVGEMMKQVGETVPTSQLGENYVNAAEKLSQGASMTSVEKDLQNKELGKASNAPLPVAKPKHSGKKSNPKL